MWKIKSIMTQRIFLPIINFGQNMEIWQLLSFQNAVVSAKNLAVIAINWFQEIL